MLHIVDQVSTFNQKKMLIIFYFCGLMLQRNLVCGWDSLTKIQNSVAQKRIQLHKEKLEMKLNFILQSQVSDQL